MRLSTTVLYFELSFWFSTLPMNTSFLHMSSCFSSVSTRLRSVVNVSLETVWLSSCSLLTPWPIPWAMDPAAPYISPERSVELFPAIIPLLLAEFPSRPPIPFDCASAWSRLELLNLRLMWSSAASSWIRKKGCLNSQDSSPFWERWPSLGFFLILWKSYLLSCRTKLAKFECLKWFGRICVVNLPVSSTTKLSPPSVQRTISEYWFPSRMLYSLRTNSLDGGRTDPAGPALLLPLPLPLLPPFSTCLTGTIGCSCCGGPCTGCPGCMGGC